MKTPKVFGLAMAFLAIVLVPVAAISEAKGAHVSEESRKKGMAEAPAVVQAAGLPCQVSDARLIGEDAKTKSKFYEVACGAGSMGFVIQAPKEGAPTVYSCIEADTPPAPGKPPAAPCMLQANEDPKAALAPLLQKEGVNCIPEQARGIGQTKTSTYMEVACQGGVGYILMASAPFDPSKPIQAQNCLMYDEANTNIKCTFGDEQARLAVVDKFANAANNGCVVKDRRFVGMSKDGSTFYEASCQSGKGYIYKVGANGAFAQAYDCATASQILGGCTLTDTRKAQSDQAALYTKLAKEAGYNTCDVTEYALFPPKPGEEDVELVCQNGTGAIGIFKPGGAGSQVYDCGHAPMIGFKCSLSKDNGYAALTADLKKLHPDTTCVVSDSRVVGRTDKGTTFMEVACADKLKGYMIEYQTSPKVVAIAAPGCALSGNCALPGNK